MALNRSRPSVQVPPFRHGTLLHSLTSVVQRVPANRRAQRLTEEKPTRTGKAARTVASEGVYSYTKEYAASETTQWKYHRHRSHRSCKAYSHTRRYRCHCTRIRVSK